MKEDKKGEEGGGFMDMGEKEIWGKGVNDGEVGVCLMKGREKRWKVDYEWKKERMYFGDEVKIDGKEYKIREVWEEKEIGRRERNRGEEIGGDGVLMVRVRGSK